MEYLNILQNSFRDLQNYTTLKHSTVLFCVFFSFRDLQNYTTLKLLGIMVQRHGGFRDLQNYTTLKRGY